MCFVHPKQATQNSGWKSAARTSPAPWNTMVWSDILLLVMRRAARRPATATAAVPGGGRGRGEPQGWTRDEVMGAKEGRVGYESDEIPWMSSLKVQYLLRYLVSRRKALVLAKSSNWIRQSIPYLRTEQVVGMVTRYGSYTV